MSKFTATLVVLALLAASGQAEVKSIEIKIFGMD